MVGLNDGRAVRAGSKTYFFDLKGTEAGEPYLVITQSRLIDEGQAPERSRLILMLHFQLSQPTIVLL